MNTIKPKYIIGVSSVSLFLLCIILIIGKIIIQDSNIRKEEYKKIEEYLSSKYQEKMVIESVTVDDTIIACCYPEYNSTIKFSVVYWVNKNIYVDSYLQTCLEREAVNTVNNIIIKLGITDFNCYLHLAEVKPYDASDRLYSYYLQKGRPLKWGDIECNETLQDITLFINNDVDESMIQQIEQIIDESELNALRISINKEGMGDEIPLHPLS